MRVIQRPAHAGTSHPVAESLGHLRFDATGTEHGRSFEQRQHLRCAEAAPRQFQQRSQGREHGGFTAETAIGDRERQHGTVACFTEHRLDVRGIAIDVRNHHHHVARLQRFGTGEALEETVAQHFELA